MDKKQRYLIGLELVWWAVTAIVVLAVLWPIQKTIYQFRFKTLNIAFIVVFLTLARYAFLLKYTFIAKRQIVKLVLLFGSFLLAFFLINGLNGFMNFIEENTWEPITGHLPTGSEMRHGTERYVWNEMLFFGTGSILATIAFAIRMVISLWRTHNLDEA